MSRKNKIVLGIMIAIGVCIFGYSLRDVPMHSLLLNLKDLKWYWLLVAFGLMFFSLVCEAWIVRFLLKKRYPDLRWRDILRVPMVEQLFNGITPFSSGGQPAQILALAQTGVDGGQATSILLMKFIVYQAMIVVNFIICMLFGFHLIASKMHVMAVLIAFGFLIHFSVIVGLLMVMYWNKFTRKLVDICLKPLKWLPNKELYPKWKNKLDAKIDTFYQESLRLKKDKKAILKIALITLLQLILYYIIPYFIILALGVHHVNLIEVTTLHVLIVMVISLFPVPGGAGGAEFSFDVIFSLYIHSSSKLVLAMILWRIVTYYFGMFLGMVALVQKPHKVKAREREAAVEES
ncbi:MAG TPA: flippase-like domain-containing protein [Candidatus Ligilactobacillus excrementigallinarum]|uniref:Phosphatidylglycerol lysyltransferase n=1 Tax=Candidatus Ligilactobacillus excrementigallinarum TaxID=2838641 RepID=A0A9D1UWF6_9LACO|nr:flippase-like domain-containing protein [Candidatus Ligilactobacillus excrementigallinarum]